MVMKKERERLLQDIYELQQTTGVTYIKKCLPENAKLNQLATITEQQNERTTHPVEGSDNYSPEAVVEEGDGLDIENGQ